MHKFWVAVTIIAASFAGLSLNAQQCKTTEADKTAVTDAMRTMYAGATADDLAKVHSVTAATFYAFDTGHRFESIDALMKLIDAYRAQGAKFVWSVTRPEVTVHCDQAWITYVNDGSVQISATAAPVPTQWLESAVLERQQGAWKIVFFHSTQVPAGEAAKKN